MRSVLLFILLAFYAFTTHSQDTHYWYSPYGPGGFLMPGAVIANNNDSSVLFYNPALLANSQKASISFSGSLYQIDRINLINGAGTNRDLKAQTFDVVPQIISGSFRVPFIKKSFLLSYALLHDPNIYFQPTQRRDETFNVLNDSYSPGNEQFIGQFIYQNFVDEFSASLSGGYAVNPKFQVGATMEAIQRKQTFSLNYTGRASVNVLHPHLVPVVSNDASYFIKYQVYSLRWKVGFALDEGHSHFGLVLHSPNVNVYSYGTLLSDNVLVNFILSDTLPPLNLIANTRQENLKITWKNPLSVAVGYSYTMPKGTIYFAAEFFPHVNLYKIMTPRAEFFLRPDTNDFYLLTPEILSLKDERKAVFNFGVGGSLSLSEKFTAFCSFRTDFSYAGKDLQKLDAGYAPYTTYWNNFHLEVGVNLRRPGFNLKSGVFFVYGSSKNYEQYINLDNPNENNFLMGDLTTITAKHFSAGIMVSFVHNFH